MSRLAKIAKQIVVALIGVPLLIIGVILIPLPGPGILVCFIALLILSLGFESAKIYVDKCKAFFRKVYNEAKERADRIEHKNDPK